MPDQKPATTTQAAPAQPATQPAATTESKNNGFAITSLILGIVSLVFSWLWFVGVFGIAAILGIVFGILGMGKKFEGKGKGMAIAGLIMSALAIVLMIGWFIFVVILAATSNSTSTSTY